METNFFYCIKNCASVNFYYSWKMHTTFFVVRGLKNNETINDLLKKIFLQTFAGSALSIMSIFLFQAQNFVQLSMHTIS